MTTDNNTLLAEKLESFNRIEGARVGDYIKIEDNFYTRITHICIDGTAQTGGSSGGSYYLSKSGASYSGGLDSGINTQHIELTEETKTGNVWFFSGDISGAHRGVTFSVPMRVYKLKEGAPLDGFNGYKKYKESQYLATLPKVTKVTGNGQIYTNPLPKIHIPSAYYSGLFEQIERVTGLTFAPNNFGTYKVSQPETYEQLVNILLTHNWSIKRYSNSTYNNDIFLTINHD